MRKLIAITLSAALVAASTMTTSFAKTANAASTATRSNTITYAGTSGTHTYAAAKTKKVSQKTTKKHVIIAKLSGNTMKYHKSIMNVAIKGATGEWDWENLVGYGKKHSIKIAKNCKYYTLGANIRTVKKVSKKKFQKSVRSYSKNKENGVVWYWGTAATLTIKNGKVVKVVQEYQA